jgi:transposase
MYIGIDIGSRLFAASHARSLDEVVFLGEFPNTPDGFTQFLARIPAPQSVKFVMEATGVYSEPLSHFLHDRRCAVYVEPPYHVSKTRADRGKTDPIDSRHLAEYGFRFPDRLHPWTPREVVLTHLRILATVRTQYTQIRTQLKNAQRALKIKPQSSVVAQTLHGQMIEAFTRSLAAVESEMKTLVTHNPVFTHHLTHLETIPGVGFWLAMNFLLITEGFTQHLQPKSLAAYLGICPFPYQSGISVYRTPHADSAGPARLRSLFYLAAMTMCKNNAQMRTYFQRKVSEGKPKKLVLNNIANKLLKLMCAIVLHDQPYDPKFLSVKPTDE